MERAVREGYSDKVSVVPFDWGGWSTLQVTAIMADGRRVTGKLKGSKERGLRVPKRAPESRIADSWKARNKGGADALDDDDTPTGDGNKGDGFTLYEEYRGFVIDGQHVEGDPKTKDFFVLNLIDGDGDAGIALFASLSGLRVHTSTLNTEISPAHRVMNANRAEGAHVVDQHAVLINTYDTPEELGGTGAFTVSTAGDKDGKVGFRPVSVTGIGILPRGHKDSDFSKPFNLSAQDAMGAFDRAIAHELMHTVGVREHGRGDSRMAFDFIAPKNRDNAIGRPYFASSGSPRQPLELRDEAKRDLAAAVYEKYAAARPSYLAFYRALYVGTPGEAGYPKMSEADYEQLCESFLQAGFELSGLVGVEGGPHSGHQDCIMRYTFANFYRMKNPAQGYYQIAPGAERMGFSLCQAPKGTGVNGDEHYPQSRHGNAAAGAGNCAAQICPNDAVPPGAGAVP